MLRLNEKIFYMHHSAGKEEFYIEVKIIAFDCDNKFIITPANTSNVYVSGELIFADEQFLINEIELIRKEFYYRDISIIISEKIKND